MKRTLTLLAIVGGVAWLAATAVLLFYIADLAPITALLVAFVVMDAAFGLLFASYLVTNTRRAWPIDPYAIDTAELLRPPLLRHEERRQTPGTLDDRGVVARLSDILEAEAARHPPSDKTPPWRIDVAHDRAGDTFAEPGDDELMMQADPILGPQPPPVLPPNPTRFRIRYGIAYCLACNLDARYCRCASRAPDAPSGDAQASSDLARRIKDAAKR